MSVLVLQVGIKWMSLPNFVARLLTEQHLNYWAQVGI